MLNADKLFEDFEEWFNMEQEVWERRELRKLEEVKVVDRWTDLMTGDLEE